METAKPIMLIVRPSARAAEDVETCLNAGWRAEVLSPVEIEADAAGLELLSEQYARADAVFWVSPTAIETAVPYLNLSDGIKIHIAVGQGSRRALERYLGRTVIAPHDGNDSEAVLRLPVWDGLREGGRVLFVRGHGGRDFLMRRLREKGLQTELAEVYFRRPLEPDWTQFAAAPPDAAWITSAESVRLLFAAAPPPFTQKLQSLLYFTHHQRVAEALRAAGATRVELIPALDIDTLNRYAEQNR